MKVAFRPNSGETSYFPATQLIDHDLTPDETLQTLELDWEVEAKDLFLADGSKVPGTKALVRNDTGEILSTASDRYRPVQNKQMFSFFNEFLDTMGLKMHSAGTLQNGRRIFAVARIQEPTFLTNHDPVEGYLVLSNSHTPGSAFKAALSTMRLVCMNALMGLLEDGEGFKHYHSATFDDNSFAAGAALLQESNKHFTILTEQMRHLQGFQVDNPVPYFTRVLGDPREAAGDQPRAVGKAVELFNGTGIGSTLPGAKGTMWGAVNAVTEYVDHHAGRTDDSRIHSALFGRGATVKANAYSTAMEMIKEAA